jgi:hypothetical protein
VLDACSYNTKPGRAIDYNSSFYTPTMVRWLVILVLSTAVIKNGAMGCKIDDVYELNSIVQSCCEAEDDPTCASGFPTSCSRACAELLSPWWDECGELATVIGNDAFDFDLDGVTAFVVPCKQTEILLARAGGDAELCNGDALEKRVAAINSACCEEGGVNVCAEGTPNQCDTECATTFIPYYEQCLDGRSVTGVGMQPFVKMHLECGEQLPPAEVALLYDDVVSKIDNPACTIDTSGIVTMTEAKAGPPVCETDAFGTVLCARMIETHQASCKADFCTFCEQAHSCDNTCGQPCAEDAGHRRLLILRQLAESAVDFDWMHDTVHALTQTCPLSSFEEDLHEVAEMCSVDPAEDPLVDKCTFDCGRKLSPFVERCGPLIEKLIDDDQHTAGLNRLDAKCLQMDPTSLVMALHNSVCTVCGDGNLSGTEQCDDGTPSLHTDLLEYIHWYVTGWSIYIIISY